MLMLAALLVCLIHPILNQSISFQSSLENDGLVLIKVQQALNGGPHSVYTERGNITVQSLRLRQAIVSQKPLSKAEQLQIQKLAESNELYKTRITVVANDGTERTFISAVKACMLAESELDDRFSVSLDYSGRVVGVTNVIASKSACEGASAPLDKLKEFTTNVYVRHTEVGAIPDTASFVQKIEREREAQEKGEVKDNRSFLAKYWMYIVPVVIVMVISSASNPEGQGGGQQ
ncbi:hypothetical protein YQE_00319, partial [Dendroctonus ponderosae]|uniref:ER membrane protein complex subunit 10 n=1 Tax=Dendroctonus ponderosae TaxID=77166 RepID=J3JU70_DENPD